MDEIRTEKGRTAASLLLSDERFLGEADYKKITDIISEERGMPFKNSLELSRYDHDYHWTLEHVRRSKKN